MAQFSIESQEYLKNNRSIYEIMYLANNANGEIVSTQANKSAFASINWIELR